MADNQAHALFCNTADTLNALKGRGEIGKELFDGRSVHKERAHNLSC